LRLRYIAFEVRLHYIREVYIALGEVRLDWVRQEEMKLGYNSRLRHIPIRGIRTLFLSPSVQRGFFVFNPIMGRKPPDKIFEEGRGIRRLQARND